MKGAGALKAHAQRMGQVGAVAGNDGGQHDGVVLVSLSAEGSPRMAAGRVSKRAAASCCRFFTRQAAERAGKLAQASHSLTLTVAVEVMP